MKKLLLIVLISFQALLSFGQRDPRKEILVLFKEGIDRSDTMVNGNTIKSIRIKKNALKPILLQMGLTESMLEVAMPRFNRADTLHVLNGGTTLKQLDMTKLVRIRVPEGINKEVLLKKIKALPEVLFAELNGVSSTSRRPNDADYGQQWALRNTIVTTHECDIHAEAAWDIYTGDSNGIIAIIDAGVDVNHPDLANKIDPSSDTWYNDPHGTYVAGIAAAQTDNGNSIAGVDWQAKILAKAAIGGVFDDADIYFSIVDAVNYSPNVGVFNNSWGLNNDDGSPGRFSILVASAFAYAYKANRVSVAAMHDYNDIYPNLVAFPAMLPDVIAVGETNIQDNVIYNSGRGNNIAVVAPGDAIYSTKAGTNSDGLFNGTSAAAPFVSGVASLLKGFNINLVNDDIKNIIELSADKVGGMLGQNFTTAYGYGRLNAASALGLLQAPNSVNHFTATGGSIYNSSAIYGAGFFSVPNLADGYYDVIIYEIRKQVTFPTTFCNIVGVWGTGIGSTGFNSFNINFGEGFTDVVPGTLTNTGVTLKTYIYDVYTSNGKYLGTYPQTPDNVTFAYTVLGVVNNETITGDDNICVNDVKTYSVPLVAGKTYNWTVSSNLSISSGQYTNSIQVIDNGSGDGPGLITLNICGNYTATKSVTVGPPICQTINGFYKRFYDNVGNFAIFSVPDQAGYTYSWSVIGLNTSNNSTTSYHGTGKEIQINSPDCTYDFWATAVTETNNCGAKLMGQSFSFDCNSGMTANTNNSSHYCIDPNAMGAKSMLPSSLVTLNADPGYYPNPGDKSITITNRSSPMSDQASAPFSYKIYDELGRVVRSGQSGGEDATVITSDLAPKTYFLHITVGDKLYKKQLVIQH